MRTITQPDQARALTNVKLIGYLHAFIGTDRSVSEVAGLWGMRLDAAYYRTHQLEQLGLIAVSREQPRAGRGQKLYRAVAERFFVPLDIIPEAGLELFLEHTGAHFQALMLRAQARAVHGFFSRAEAGQWGFQIGLNSDRQPDVHLGKADGSPPDLDDPDLPTIADGWPELQLDLEDAQAFRRELVELFRRYARRRGARRYLTHFALAPLE